MRPLQRSSTVWLLVLVFAAEFFLFDHFGSRRITGIFPRWNDQVQYLGECYTGYEYARSHGLFAGLWHTLVNPSAQGTLHDVAALLEFEVVGPSRSAALALNLFALIAWQVALFCAVRRRSLSTGLAWFAALLPVVLRGPWDNIPGSAYDFRLDHLALCGLGVTSALALATDGLRRRGASVAFGVATGLTLLTRFITGTYFVVIYLLLAVWSFAGADRRQRVQHWLLAAGIGAAMALPIFWINREWVWNYYYIGHYVGPESAIRNQNFGVIRSVQYVFGWLGERHLGTFFIAFAIVITVVLVALRFLSLRPSATLPPSAVPDPEPTPTGSSSAAAPASLSFAYNALVNGSLFLFGPALVLTLHPQKSEVVLSALVPGVVLIVIGVWAAVGRAIDVGVTAPATSRSSAPRASNPLVQGAAPRSQVASIPPWLPLVATIGALGYFGYRQFVTFEGPEAMDQFRQVNAIADYVVDQADAAKLPVIRVAVDHITDALDAQVLRIVCYERRHVWKDWDMKLPTGIAEPDTATVEQRVAESDFVFLTDDDSSYAGLPYDKKLAALRPQLRAWCAAHLVAVRHFTLRGHAVTLYQRQGK
jgi:hypothetical protein